MGALQPYDNAVLMSRNLARRTLRLSDGQWAWIDLNLDALAELAPADRERFTAEGEMHWNWKAAVVWGALSTLVTHPQARPMMLLLPLLVVFDLAMVIASLLAR